MALSEFIAQNPAIVRGKNVLEIGCGLGLPGIISAIIGANVILTDYLAGALKFAEYNWKLNVKTPPDIRLLDWRHRSNIAPVDVLLASDVAYESRSFLPLLNAFKSLIRKNGIVILSEPNRKFAREFFEQLKTEGFHLTEHVKNVVKDNIRYKVSIYILCLEHPSE
jgi:predicted nicotinamide N-methyase